MEAITNLNDFAAKGLKAERILGAGAMGCVLQGTLNSEACVFKILPVGDQPNVILAEYYIGQKVSTLPDGIRQLFAGSIALYYSAVGLPDDWKKMLEASDKETCQNLATSDPVYIIAQEYVDGMNGAAWLDSQKFPLTNEVVRPIIFQLTLALCYANAVFGFQHNDLKLENMFLIPSKGETITYQIGKDTFEVKIPDGGATIRIIDFGFSSMNSYEVLPDFLGTSGGHTAGYAPFDLCLNRSKVLLQTDSPLEFRQNDADMPAIFMIMMNLVAHRRNAEVDDDTQTTVSAGKFWTYTLSKDGNGVDYIADTDATLTKGALHGFFLNGPGFKRITTGTESETQKDYEAEVVGNISSYVLVPLLVLYSLGAYPNVAPTYADTIPISIQNDLTNKWQIILGTEFQSAFANATTIDAKSKKPLTLTKQFIHIPYLLDECFGKGSMAIDFCRILFAPLALQRQEFGVLDSRYCLANALYHPFLAYPYWSTTYKSGGFALAESQAPYAFMTPQPPSLKADAEQALAKFEALSKAPATVTSGKSKSKATPGLTPAPAPAPAPASKDKDETTTTGDGGGKASLAIDGELRTYLQTAITGYKNQTLKALSAAEIQTLTDQFIFPMTKRVFDLFTDKATRALFAQFDGFRDAKGDVYVGTTKAYNSKWKMQQFYAASMVYIYAAIILANKGNANPLFNQLKTFWDNNGKTPLDSKVAWDAQLKNVTNILQPILTFAKDNGLTVTESEIRDTISSHLEVIERNEDYLSTEGAYDLPTINEELYIPLQEAIRTHQTPLDEKLIKHLGLGDELFRDYAAFHGIDMTDASNQTRYFHTLSIVANMMETGNYDQLERCYVEWPPKVHVAGQIHEI